MPGPWRLSFLLGALAALPATCADGPLVPVTVCEVLGDLPMYDGKVVAALGRYSFREKGRWLSEESCGDGAPENPTLWLMEDAKDGPRPPDDFEMDGAVLGRKLADVRKRTALGKFRFGTSDYDRWAVVYGRVETRKGDAAKTAPADLEFRGDGVVVFLTP
jgi:hypothetical protein